MSSPSPAGRRNTFQHGYIFWNATTRLTTVVYS
jgi:hypothetical protein